MNTAKLTSCPAAKKMTEADENLRKFYLELAHRLCTPPENPESDNAWLWKLHAMSQKMVKLFTTLSEHTSFDQVTAIHRACGHFLMKNDVPQKDRRQVIDILACWSSLFVGMLQARASITPMQEEYIRRVHEIRRLATPEPEAKTEEKQSVKSEENTPPVPGPTPEPVAPPAKRKAGKKE